MHRSDAAVKRIVCRRHVSTYTSNKPGATPGATSRELLPTTPESYSRCNKPGATPDYSRELLPTTPGATSRELLSKPGVALGAIDRE